MDWTSKQVTNSGGRGPNWPCGGVLVELAGGGEDEERDLGVAEQRDLEGLLEDPRATLGEAHLPRGRWNDAAARKEAGGRQPAGCRCCEEGGRRPAGRRSREGRGSAVGSTRGSIGVNRIDTLTPLFCSGLHCFGPWAKIRSGSTPKEGPTGPLAG